MGVSDCMEGVMDEEAKQVLEMSDDELNARFGGGSREPDLLRAAPLVVKAETVSLTGFRFRTGEGPVVPQMAEIN